MLDSKRAKKGVRTAVLSVLQSPLYPIAKVFGVLSLCVVAVLLYLSSRTEVGSSLQHARKLAVHSLRGLMREADNSHLHGIVGMDEFGAPLWSPQPLDHTMTLEEKGQAHKGYCFNTWVSQSLPLDRPFTDYRSGQCQAVPYDRAALGTCSVVMVFHNENLSALLRSVHSVLNRTPPELLEEIVLVDDNSNHTTHTWLSSELRLYVSKLPKTRLIRLDERHGLMRARMVGVDASTGPKIMFLDSHIEVGPGWLEPLLARIAEDPKNVVMPFIHTLEADTLVLKPNYLSILSFSWRLGQTHPHKPPSDFEPMPSTVMAGGLFAIDKAWFSDLGGYDREMRLYGGEEMEISFKIWMCGGRLEALPCSRVGHIFRTPDFWKGQVYTVPGDEIYRNKLRTAEVWMDEYKEIVKLSVAPLPASNPLGSVEEQMAVRERQQCHSFRWFLENVATDMYIPEIAGGHTGSLKVQGSKLCMDTLSFEADLGTTPGMYPCHDLHGTQAFFLDAKGKFRIAVSDFKRCIDVSQNKPTISMCDSAGQWRYAENGGLLQHLDTGSCLNFSSAEGKLSMASCDDDRLDSLWFNWVA